MLEATVEEVEDLGLYEWWLVVSTLRKKKKNQHEHLYMTLTWSPKFRFV